MIDVGPKTATFRRATAQGKIILTREAFDAILKKENPKGDVLAVAELAGIQAAKKTAEWIPLCHPLPLDQIRMRFEAHSDSCSIVVHCQVSTTAKTGVEMEALCGVNGALLSIYDLSKAVNPVLTLTEIRLNTKEGGKKGFWHHPDFKSDLLPPENSPPPSQTRLLQGVRAGVITVSDRCSHNESVDASGPELIHRLKTQGADVSDSVIVPDDIESIRSAVLHLIRETKAELVILTGGTGLSPRDVTPEALSPLWTKKIPGLGELLRSQGAAHTPMSWLSRSETGLVDSTLVILLPGSLKAVQQSWSSLEKILPHALHTLRGGRH
jgi:molybdenum cofactor biosynthesis protein MoaC